MTDDPRIRRYRDALAEMLGGRFDVDLPGGDDDLGRLGAALRDLGSVLGRKFAEQEALLRVTQDLNRGTFLDEVLDHLYDSFRAVIPYDRIGVALLERENRILRARWARTMLGEPRLGVGFSAPMAGSSLQEVIATGRPRILNDLVAYLAEHPGSTSTRRVVEEGVRSSLTCPLVSLGAPIGFIFFSSATPGAYRDVHVEVFQQVAGQVSAIVEKGRLYERLLEEQARAEALLLNVLPESVAERLKRDEGVIADAFGEASIVFADIVGFTALASRVAPVELVRFLDGLFSTFDALTVKHGIEKIKTIGDAYMAASGIPTPRRDHVEAAASFALDVVDAVAQARTPTGEPLSARVGMHAGPVVAGVIGRKKFHYDLWGDAVNIASRLESHGAPGRVHVSEEVAARLGDAFAYEPRGSQHLKGRGEMRTYFLLRRSATGGPAGAATPA